MAGDLLIAAAAATAAKPAGGAATGEVVGATAGAMVATTILFALAIGHRSGRVKLLSRAADRAARMTGLPPWAALPTEREPVIEPGEDPEDRTGWSAPERPRG